MASQQGLRYGHPSHTQITQFISPMQIIQPEIEHYITAHTEEEPPLLQQLSRETHLKVLRPRMLSGHVQGRFLALLSKLCRPKSVLEIGTYTGYSALCLAEGMPPDGQLITIDSNDELKEIADRYIAAAGMQSQISLLNGHAPDVIEGLTGPFDMVFIDADKENYSLYFDLVIEKVTTGGLIVADNVLWYGKVVAEDLPKKAQKDTEAIKAYNQKVQRDSRVEHVLLPLRDGLMIARKR